MFSSYSAPKRYVMKLFKDKARKLNQHYQEYIQVPLNNQWTVSNCNHVLDLAGFRDGKKMLCRSDKEMIVIVLYVLPFPWRVQQWASHYRYQHPSCSVGSISNYLKSNTDYTIIQHHSEILCIPVLSPESASFFLTFQPFVLTES